MGSIPAAGSRVRRRRHAQSEGSRAGMGQERGREARRRDGMRHEPGVMDGSAAVLLTPKALGIRALRAGAPSGRTATAEPPTAPTANRPDEGAAFQRFWASSDPSGKPKIK